MEILCVLWLGVIPFVVPRRHRVIRPRSHIVSRLLQPTMTSQLRLPAPLMMTLSSVAVAQLASASARANPPNAGTPEKSTVRPVRRTDRNSLLAVHAQLLEKARKGGIDLYFEGDSITRRWGTSDAKYKDFLANWKENFYGWNAGKIGRAGIRFRTFCVLWRRVNWTMSIRR